MTSFHSKPNFFSTATFECCLGNGSFGIVLKATNQSNISTAVKFIFSAEVDPKEQERIRRECQLTTELEGHENVIKILNVVEYKFTAEELEDVLPDAILSQREQLLKDGYVSKAKRLGPVGVVCIEMELCGETLKRWIEQQQQREENNIVHLKQTIVKNVIAGLKYLHDNKILHRDLKPENIMFSKAKYQLPVKIGDFGLCRKLDPDGSTLTSRIGTADYMAPEAYGNKYSLQADLFSLGLVIWEIVQLIHSGERRNLFDRLVNDKEEDVVVDHYHMAGIKKMIIGLTKKKSKERIQGLAYVMKVAEGWYHFDFTESEFTVKTDVELKFCLEKVSYGGTIKLLSCEYAGVFHLKQHNVKVCGVEGSVLKCMGTSSPCLTIEGDGCSVSNVAIVSGVGNIGINILGSKNKIRNVKLRGSHCIDINGDKNHLQNLNISNAEIGIWILGCKNTVESVELESVRGILVDSKSIKNSLSNINGRGMKYGIEIDGSYNNVSNVNLIKNSTEYEFTGVWLGLRCVDNNIENLTCSGYESSKNDWGLYIQAEDCRVQNSQCGPVCVLGMSDATLTNVDCGELIRVNSFNIPRLIKCRGKKLEASENVTLTDCNFDNPQVDEPPMILLSTHVHENLNHNKEPAGEYLFGGVPARDAALGIQRAYRRYCMVKEFQRIKTERRLSRRINNNIVGSSSSPLVNSCDICIEVHQKSGPHHHHDLNLDGLEGGLEEPHELSQVTEVEVEMQMVSSHHNSNSAPGLLMAKPASHSDGATSSSFSSESATTTPLTNFVSPNLSTGPSTGGGTTLCSKESEILRKRLYRVGLNLFNKKPEVGVTYLVKEKFVEGSPSSVARFLISRKGLSKQMIGKYLTNLQSPFSMSCLEHFVNEIDLSSLPVDLALRKFQCYYRMPGEAQKIERLMESFSRRYAACNPHVVSQFRNCADTVFVLAFAIIMLNTDLHTPHLKADRRMKVEDFIKNLRNVDNGGDIDKEILVGIYDKIKATEFKTVSDHVTQVMKVQQTIVGKKPNLVVPHRRLVCYCRLYQVPDTNKKEKAGTHQREVFLFNDLLVLTKIFHKKRNSVTYSFCQSYPLQGLTLALFSNQYFEYGLALKRGEQRLLNLNARNEHDRANFTEDLREAIAESDEMARIETLSKENRDRDSGVDVGKIKRFSNSLLDINDQCKPVRRGSC